MFDGLMIQVLFHYGVALVGGQYAGYESTFISSGDTRWDHVLWARRAKERAGLKGAPIRTRRERETLGYALISMACADADVQGLDPYTGH